MKTEVNTISEYLTTITPLPPYLPYPRFLLTENLSLTAKLLYTLLLDRATLSQKNSWVDERGFVYVIFPLSSLSKVLQCSTMSVKRALRTLEDHQDFPGQAGAQHHFPHPEKHQNRILLPHHLHDLCTKRRIEEVAESAGDRREKRPDTLP